ncbi:carbon-nitrogen hydrolase family protein [uncultured Brachyspira sp.]|uniref:carbon-nitrogen hydrolase family protein n=1 Tax=uncultured Brachyspira sp. TaxID=221953 RepID=UPI0026089EF8|nr:carbon-nitrogen hydrolase family protein [uncultured Brachyspira sp.]
MRVSFIQFDVKKDKKENINIIEKHVKNNDANLIVLPELSSSGYLFEKREDLLKVSENIENITNKTNEKSIFINEILKISKKYSKAIIAGFAENFKDKIYNSALIAENGHFKGVYRKVHLSDFEKKFFDSGDIKESYNVFEVCKEKLSIQICFDVWFSEISRKQILKGSNLICILANFGGENTLEIAKVRAIENITPIILCNRVGREKTKDIDAYFIGKSFIIDKDGSFLANADKDETISLNASIEINNVKSNIICSNFYDEIKKHY